MSEKSQSQLSEKPLYRLKNRGRKTGALVLSVGAMSGILAPTVHAEQSGGPGGEIEHFYTKFKKPTELPGRKIHLGGEILNQLKSATVELGIRLRPDLQPSGTPEEPFQPFCTAVRVNVDGDPSAEFTTAAHCLSDMTGAKHGALKDTLNPGIKAENFTNLSQYQFAILDPQELDVDARKVRPVAIVDQISVSTDDKDTALMRVSPVTYPDTSAAVRSLDQIPSLPYRALKRKPKPGTPVALYGVPTASGFEPVAKTGMYLGRIDEGYYDDSIKQYIFRKLDIVGINAPVPQSDSCNFGASGSLVELPDGETLGNLAERDNLGFGPTHSMQSGDLSLSENINWIIQKEHQLGIKIRGYFNTVCAYTVLDKNTPQQMVVGYGIAASGKGGDPSGGQG